MAIRIPLELVESSNLRAVGYDAPRSILAIQFKSGEIYHSAGVPYDVWLEFCAAPSKGSYYALNIRGKYQGQKMTGECPKCGDRPGWIGDRCESCGCADYAGAILHALVWDHPDASSKRERPAVCGQWFRPNEFARSPDAVTCPECRQIVDEREAMGDQFEESADDPRRG